MATDLFRAIKRMDHAAFSMRAAHSELTSAMLEISQFRTEHADNIAALDAEDREMIAKQLLQVAAEVNEAMRGIPAFCSLITDTWQLISPELAAAYEAHEAAQKSSQH